MSSSQNSEKTPSQKSETKGVEKYGFTLQYYIMYTTRDEWAKVYRDPDGNVIPDDKLEELAKQLAEKGESRRIKIDWELTGKTITCAKVSSASFKSNEEQYASPIELFATPEGPIMAINTESVDDSEYALKDPCVVVYDGKGKINLVPIFNVVDFLYIKKSAVRNVQAPNEILLGLYPQFVMQNRMMKYQLRPTVPFASSPELTTDADN